MNAVQLLGNQLRGMNATLHELADDLTDEEWHSRPSPSQNIVSFAAWHIPRVQDHFVHTWIRNIPELCTGEPWQAWHPLQKYGSGIGITLQEADLIAHLLQPKDILEYADTVTAGIVDWLLALPESELDRIPDAAAHLAPFLECHTKEYKADTDHLLGKPIWRLLSGPCISHVRGHMGELALQKTMLREQ
jgi:hypothetical protein